MGQPILKWYKIQMGIAIALVLSKTSSSASSEGPDSFLFFLFFSHQHISQRAVWTSLERQTHWAQLLLEGSPYQNV